MWNDQIHQHKRCACGARLTIIGLASRRHRDGARHRHGLEAKRLRDLGLTYAEIARQLGGYTRAYVRQIVTDLEVADG